MRRLTQPASLTNPTMLIRLVAALSLMAAALASNIGYIVTLDGANTNSAALHSMAEQLQGSYDAEVLEIYGERALRCLLQPLDAH